MGFLGRLFGKALDDDDEEREAAARAEEIRKATARILAETKRQVAQLERRQRGTDGNAGHAGA